jgi:hypothetical protein
MYHAMERNFRLVNAHTNQLPILSALPITALQECAALKLRIAPMDKFDSEAVLIQVRVEWKSASTRHGELCVTMIGTWQMLW